MTTYTIKHNGKAIAREIGESPFHAVDRFVTRLIKSQDCWSHSDNSKLWDYRTQLTAVPWLPKK